MADLTQTPGNVSNGSSSSFLRLGTAGEALTAGDLVYADAEDSGKYKKCDNGAEGSADVVGMAMSTASDDNPVIVLIFANGVLVGPGATVTVGEMYVVSANAGKWAPIGDLGSSQYMSVVGIGVTSALVYCTPAATGYLHG